MSEITNDAKVAARQRERLFYSGMCLVFGITVFAGFAKTFFLRPYFHPEPLVPLLILHGVVFTSWIVLLLIQTTLIAKRQIRIHRRLGVAGASLATIVVTIGVITAILRTDLSGPPGSPSPLIFLTIPLGDMLVFGILVGAGFYFRHRPDIHKRLMILATIALLPAAVVRLPLRFIFRLNPMAFYGVTDLFILPCLIYDMATRDRPHRATLLGGLLLIISQPLRFVIGRTHAWLAFATWLIHLIR